jgi:RHS repeat-associated protein
MNLKLKAGTLELDPAWDMLGQMWAVWSSATGWTYYGYDGWGRRIRRSTSIGGVSVNTYYVHDGDHVAVEYDDQGSTPRYYSYYPGVDRPHGLWSNYAQYYYAQDAEGNVTGLLDRNGSVVNEYRYTPFGQAESVREGVPNALRFKGRELDPETGFYYMRARYYDPHLGRFISEDPIGLAGGINPYVFAGNDPINYADPYGLDTCDKALMYVEGGVVKCPGGGPATAAPITVTAPWPFATGRSWGASSNFGNPYARGSTGCCTASQAGDVFAGAGQMLAPFQGPAEIAGEIATLPLAAGSMGGRVLVPIAGRLTGFTKHGINSAINHNGVGVATWAILDAVKNPLRTVAQSGDRMRYVGQNAVVVLNSTGRVITTWARSSAAWRIRP